jgi:flagellar hook-associated protein 2
MMSTTGIFTGNSQFASSFQQEISRAVSFASFPMQQMQSEVTTLTSQSGELSKLNADFFSLQAAISGLDNALGAASYNAASSTPSVASATLGDSPSPGTYSVEVDTIGTAASAMSNDDGLAKVTDPSLTGISNESSYSLTLTSNVSGDSRTFAIETSDTTLAGLAAAINHSDCGVKATVVNVGTDGTFDYRISLRDDKMEDVTIDLGGADNPSMLTPQTSGAPTEYKINGKELTTGSSSITLAPGVTVSLAAAGSTTITVAQNTNAVAAALSNLVTAYNAAQTEINANRGAGTGGLQGQSILSSLSEVLHRISGYATGTDGISSLTALGVTFDKTTFALTFNSDDFAAATKGQIPALASFLGSSTTGGFLKTVNDALDGLTDPAQGLFQSSLANLKASIARDNDAIAADRERIDALTTSLNARMAAADTAVAALEQQYSYLNQMFAQMQANSKDGG